MVGPPNPSLSSFFPRGCTSPDSFVYFPRAPNISNVWAWRGQRPLPPPAKSQIARDLVFWLLIQSLSTGFGKHFVLYKLVFAFRVVFVGKWYQFKLAGILLRCNRTILAAHKSGLMFCTFHIRVLVYRSVPAYRSSCGGLFVFRDCAYLKFLKMAGTSLIIF